MKYLTEREYIKLGYPEIENFNVLAKKAETTIDIYTNNYYSTNFDSEIGIVKSIIKEAVACQINYLHESGILTADEKMMISDITMGRTSIKYNNSSSSSLAFKLNLSVDAENLLKSIGFGYAGVKYDR